MPSFKEKVAEEAKQQRELRGAGKPVPASLKRYARLSGLIVAAAGGVGMAAVWLVGAAAHRVFVGAILFMGAFGLLGLVQAISGRNFLRR